MSELPIKATIKAGGNQADPWVTVGANSPEELADRLGRMDAALSKTAEVATRFVALRAVADTLGGQHVETQYAAPPQSAPAPQPPAPPTDPGPPPFSAAPAPAPGGVQEDKWGNTYETGRPDAPNTAYGPAVLKRGTSQAGKPYTRWIDPRDKAIPSVYASGQRDNPADLWPGDWAKV